MSICLCDLSALACLRQVRDAQPERPGRPGYYQEVHGWPDSVSPIIARRLAACGIPAPDPEHELHVLLDARNKGGLEGDWIVPHTWARPLTRGSVIDAGYAVATSSPEFLFLQMGTRLDLVDLVRLGLELCGCYRMGMPSSKEPFPTDHALMGAQPLTSAAQLRSYLARSPDATGIREARRASLLVADGMMSHHAAGVYLLLCLPNELGGYGLPLPVPGVAGLASRRRDPVRGDHLVPELYWPKANVGIQCAIAEIPPKVEYARMAWDREAALREGRSRLIVAGASDVADTATMHAIARQLARRLGVRMPLLDREFRSRREALRARIVPAATRAVRAAWAA